MQKGEDNFDIDSENYVSVLISSENLPATGGNLTLWVEDLKDEIILIRTGEDKFEVLSSFCPHAGGMLEVDGEELVCSFHGLRFSASEKKCINSLENFTVSTYLNEFSDQGLRVYVKK